MRQAIIKYQNEFAGSLLFKTKKDPKRVSYLYRGADLNCRPPAGGYESDASLF